METDLLGNTTTYTYNTHGLVTQINYSGDLSPVQYTYYANNDLHQATDECDNTTTYTYDNLDRLTQVTQPADENGHNPITTYSYDADGNLIRETDPLGNLTTYSYDGLGRLTENEPAGPGQQRHAGDHLSGVFLHRGLLQRGRR